MTSKMLQGTIKASDPVTRVCYEQFNMFDISATLGQLSHILNRDHFVIITRAERRTTSDGTIKQKHHIHGIVTRIDLLNYLMQNEEHV
jgi:cystathionine beta-synthase